MEPTIRDRAAAPGGIVPPTIRERAEAAWRERQQEVAVEDERQATEVRLATVRLATAAVVEALRDGEARPWGPGAGDLASMARDLGIGVSDVDAEDGRVEFVVDGIDLVVQGIDLTWQTETSMENRPLVHVPGECETCGATILLGPVNDLATLGDALERLTQPERWGHTCAGPEPIWQGSITLTTALAGGADPALVLLDALAEYVQGVVRQAMAEQEYRNDDEAIDLVPDPLHLVPEGESNR